MSRPRVGTAFGLGLGSPELEAAADRYEELREAAIHAPPAAWGELARNQDAAGAILAGLLARRGELYVRKGVAYGTDGRGNLDRWPWEGGPE